jgi:hypothetical protein
MPNPPGMTVSAVGTVDGVEIFLANQTDEEIDVNLNVVAVSPTETFSNTELQPLVKVPPNSMPTDPFSVQYFWSAPAGVYDAYVTPIGGSQYEVGTNLVVTDGGDSGNPVEGHHFQPFHHNVP